MKKLFLSSTIFLITISLFAQEQKDTVVNNLEEVVVTATKTELKTIDLPTRVQTVPIYRINANNVFTIDDILSQISGVTVSRNDGMYSKKSEVTLRGMGHEQGRALILMDGVPLNKLSTGSVNWNMIDPANVYRIEVVKGPGSSLYGGNAMGGTINIISRKPEGGTHGHAEVDYGTYNTVGANAGVSLKYGKIYGGANGFFRRGDGYNAYPKELQDEQTIAAPLMEYRAGGYLGVDFNKNNQLQINGGYYDGTRGTGDRIFYGDETIDAKGRYQDQEYRLRYSGKGINNSWEVSAFLIKEKMSETKYKSKNLYDVISYRDDWGVWGNYSHQFGTHFRLTAGAEYKGGRVNGQDVYVSATDIVYNQGSSTTLGAFIQGELSFFENKFAILPSLRYDYSHFFDGRYLIENKTNATSAMHQFISDDLAAGTKWQGAFSPKLALQYKFNDSSRLFASFSSGWRPGTLEDKCWFGVMKSGFIIANPDLKGERIYSYELGGDVLIGKKFNISVSGYYSDGHDFIYQVRTGRTFPDGKKTKDELKNSNIAKVEIYGAELDLVYNNLFVKGLDLFGNYTFTHATIAKFNKTQEADTDITGKFLTYTPMHQVAAGAVFRSKYINLSVTYRYLTEQYMKDNNTTDEGAVIAAHGLLDAKIWYTLKNMLTFTIGGNNLINERFLTSSDQLSIGRYLYAKVGFRF